MSRQLNDTSTFTKPHLFTLIAKINGHKIKILLDPGSDYTLICKPIIKKLNPTHHGSTLLDISSVAGCSTTTNGNMYSLIIPTNEGDISITGYNINETTSNVDENNIENLANEWPNLNDTIRKEVIKNRFLGQADLLIGQDNYWTLVLEGVIKHPSERFGIINTKLRWTMGGRISNTYPITCQQVGSMKSDI